MHIHAGWERKMKNWLDFVEVSGIPFNDLPLASVAWRLRFRSELEHFKG